MSDSLELLYTLVKKDFVLEMRRKTEVLVSIVFSIAAGVLTARFLAGIIISGTTTGIALGTMMLMVFLSVFASLSSFLRESEEGTLNLIKLSPVGGEVVFLSKLIYSFILIFMEVIVYFLSVYFFSGGKISFGIEILSVIVPATIYFASVSSLASAITVASEARGVLLPSIILVFVLPFIHATSRTVSVFFAGVEFGGTGVIWGLALGFTIICLALSKYVMESI